MTGDDAARRDRVTTAALIPLVIFFVGYLQTLTAPDDQTVRLVAIVAGAFLPSLYWHPYRVLGLAAPALTAAATAVTWAAVAGTWGEVAVAVVAFGLGLCFGAIARLHGDGRLGWVAKLRMLALVLLGVALVVLARQLPPAIAGPFAQIGYPIGLGLAALFAWLRLFRPAFELASEPVLWVMYKVRATGPGLADFPTRGPCLVVANHACWLDPVFLAKILPRRITPMMTSKFYDVPVLRRLMRAFGVIRVQEATVKHDPTEIREAIAALDRGECVLIFPEGAMRRSEEKPLKRFGRGVWQILQVRPNTPVFTCWIEGGWGSYCSYYNGKPTKNKKPDFRRPISVGVSAPVVVDAATLESHLPTRIFLMNRVAEARKHLGLPELPAYELPSRTEEDADNADSGADTRGSESDRR